MNRPTVFRNVRRVFSRVLASPILRILCGVLVTLTACRAGDLRDGDLVFQDSGGRQGQAVAAATHSPLTHMGVVFIEDGMPFVYEAVQPVRRTALAEWAERGAGGVYFVRRLKDPDGRDFRRLKAEVRKFLGRDYDALFDWSDDRIYCSELAWKSYRRAFGVELGRLRRLGDFDLEAPVVRALMRERYGDRPPLEMPVIAPSDLFASDLLVDVPVALSRKRLAE
jgi:hypothetical protein